MPPTTPNALEECKLSTKKGRKETQAKIERTVGFCVDDEKVRGVKNGSNVTPVDVSGLDRAQRASGWI